MNQSALFILFCTGFEQDELAYHEDLITQHTSDIAVHAYAIGNSDDLAAVEKQSREYRHFAVWNCYWLVDDLSALIGKTFDGKLVGSRESITSLTTFKSVMYETFRKNGIPCTWNLRVDTIGELHAASDIPYPVIVKVDAGYDTIDMSEKSICADAAELEAEVTSLLEKHSGVMIQQFLDGREFTVAYGNHTVFAPVHKVYESGRQIYLSGQSYQKKYCDDPALDHRVRQLADKVAKAFCLQKTDYCRIDIREDSATGELYPIDANDMCSVYPASQFEYSLAGDGATMKDFVSWLTSPIRFDEVRDDTVIYIPYHSDLSQVENLLPFIKSFRCKVFVYRWVDSAEYMFRYFSETLGAETFYMSVDSFTRELEKETDNVIVMMTEALSYSFGECQKRFFEVARDFYPRIIDVLSIGHCLAGSTCDACKSDIGHIPIKYTAYKQGLLPFDSAEIVRTYNITEKTVLVSPTTGDDFILLSCMDLLTKMKELENRGVCDFLFKLHPSTIMMAFDDVDYQLEKQGYAFVRENFRIVEKEHFSIFPFAEVIDTHITDLYSSMPAILTYFKTGILLAKENPTVRKDHPLRPYLHIFDTADELEQLLLQRRTLGHKHNGYFWTSNYNYVTGQEAVSVAFDRKWCDKRLDKDARRNTLGHDAFRIKIQEIINECKELLVNNTITEDDYSDVTYYLEEPLKDK